MPLSRFVLPSSTVVGVLLVGLPCGADEPTKQMCVAANESAQDLQQGGKLVEARAQLRTCAEKACPRAVRQDCADRLRAVEKALPTVVLKPMDAAGGTDVSAAALAIDGVAVPEALDGTPVPVDPGQHTFTVILAGRAPVSLRLSLNEGEQVRRDVVFRPAHATGAKPTASEDAAGPDGQSPASAASSPEASTGRPKSVRWVGWSAIAVGAAGMTLGSIFGIVAVSKKSLLSSACRGWSCPPESQSDMDALHANAVAANISFVVGVLGLGAGAALLVLLPDSKPADGSPAPPAAIRARPWVGLGDVGLLGSFP